MTDVSVWLSGPVRSEMANFAAVAAPRETGGVLLGWWDDDMVVVRHAIEVPDKAASRFSWNRRPRATRKALDAALAALDHPLLGYVGDWHCHPASCGASSQDEASVAKTSRSYKRPLALLVQLPDDVIDARAAQGGTLRRVRIHDTDPRGAP